MSRVFEPHPSPFEFPANDAPTSEPVEGLTDHVGVLLPQARVRVLVVGGSDQRRAEIEGFAADRRRSGGLHAVLEFVAHSREAFEKFGHGQFDTVVVYDDLTGKTVLGWAREAARTIPCVCIVESAQGVAAEKQRYELRRSGAHACVLAGDLCGPTFDAAIRGALELAAARDAVSERMHTDGWVQRAAFERELEVAMTRADADPTAKLRVVYVDASRLVGLGADDPAFAVQLRTEFEKRLALAAAGLTA